MDNLSDIIKDTPFEQVLRQVGQIAKREGIAVYAIGGVVRDALLGRSTTDIDFVTVGAGSGIRLAEAVTKVLGGRTVQVYPHFGTAAVRLPANRRTGKSVVLEFVGARRESYHNHSRNPKVEEGTLEDDQRRRDFTINAMGIHLEAGRFGQLIDPFNGSTDLERQRIRTPQDPCKTFEDDPLRIVRAARFAAQLGFSIERETFEAMREKAHRVQILSQERITEEIQKIIVCPVPSIGFKLLYDSDILTYILPELTALQGVEAVDAHRHKDIFFHTLQVLDNVASITSDRNGNKTRWLRWAALLHDIAKPQTKKFADGMGWTFHGHEDRGVRMVPKIFQKLRLPTDERLFYVQELIRLHHRPVALVDENVTDSAVRRLLFDAGDNIDDLMILVRADITSKNPHRVRRYLDAFDRVEEKMAAVEAKDNLRRFQPPVDGHEIMETLGIDAGVVVGIIKHAIREAILDGHIPNEHDAAFEHMMAIEVEARRRGALFEAFIRTLKGPERAATGAIKEEIFNGDIPRAYSKAMAHLNHIKNVVLEETK